MVKKRYIVIILILSLGVMAYRVMASSVGPNGPGTTVDDATVGTVAWTNPNNAQANDNVYATATGGAGLSTSHYLKATNFGFSIPAGATINGILVENERKGTLNNNGVADSSIKIVLSSGSFGTTDKADTATTWPTTEAFASYGSSSDLWGTTWAPSDINNSNFGVGISATLKGVGGPSCVSPDTLVSTPRGQIQIKNLKKGEQIYSFNVRTAKKEIDTITAIASEPISINKNIYYDISTSDGNTIKATVNHKFYSGGNWVYANTLKISDELLDANLRKTIITNITIEKNYTDFVWNMDVQNNQNFFAENTLVHNGLTETGSIDYIRITIYYTISGTPQVQIRQGQMKFSPNGGQMILK